MDMRAEIMALVQKINLQSFQPSMQTEFSENNFYQFQEEMLRKQIEVSILPLTTKPDLFASKCMIAARS